MSQRSSHLKMATQLPDLNPIAYLGDVVEWEVHSTKVQLTNLQQLCIAVMSTWTRGLKEHIVESIAMKTGDCSESKHDPIVLGWCFQ